VIPNIISGVLSLLVGLILGAKTMRGCLQFFDVTLVDLLRKYILCQKPSQDDDDN